MKLLPHQKRSPPPLDGGKLRDLALHYAGRYATTKAKLARYLARKIRERGWDAAAQPDDIDALVEDFAALGYVNDAAYAEARSRSLARRGYGKRRLEQDLSAAGIGKSDARGAQDAAYGHQYDSAHIFARRKKIGPYAAEIAPPEIKRKQLAAFVRAGHDFDVARRFVDAAPGEEIAEY